MLIFEIFHNNFFNIFSVNIFDIGGTPGEVIEYVTNLQVVKVKVSLVKLSIGFL